MVAFAALALIVFGALVIAALGVWMGFVFYAEEAAEPDPTPVVAEPEPGPAQALAELPEGFVFSPIPGLSVVDVTAHLRYGPEEDWTCSPPNPTPTKSGTLWTCVSSGTPAGDGSPSEYVVRVVGEDPLTVVSVEATVYAAGEEEAAEVLGHIAGLSLKQTDQVGAASNPEAWVKGAVDTGGRLAVASHEGRTILSLYGSDEERTLSVVGFDVPEEPPAFEVTVPEDTNGD